MKITNIKECGSNNILRWAISKGANIKDEIMLNSFINNDLCYLVTIADLNFLEVFRLTQEYRDKLRIIESKTAELPATEKLLESFPGSIVTNPEQPDQSVQVTDIVEHAATMFINLVLQMETDNDIIQSSTPPLFIPMIASTYTVQIPISFMDMVGSISVDEANRLFNLDYPKTINDIIEANIHGFKHAVMCEMVKRTSVFSYNDKYEKYMSILKFSPLRKIATDKLYKTALTGFFRYDPVSRGEVRCELFNSSQESVKNSLKNMSWLKTPLYIEFAVQLPLYYMQILANSLPENELSITYQSSINDIVKSGLVFNDFISQEFYKIENGTDPENNIESYNNEISAYKVRITEANSITLKAINDILGSDADVSTTSVYALLPSIYTTKAIITVSADKVQSLVNHSDPLIAEMFETMAESISGVVSDIEEAGKNN